MWNASWLVLGCAFAAGSISPAFPATNGLDVTFGNGGLAAPGATPISAVSIGRLRALAVQPDGRILIGGSRSGFATGAVIGRLNANGSWDSTFGDHGAFVLPDDAASAPSGGEIHEIIVLSDDSIVAAGGRYAAGGGFDSCTLLVKLSSAGALDPAFGPDQSGSFCLDFAPDTNHFYLLFHYEGLLRDSSNSLFLTTPYTNLTHGAVAHLDSNGAPVMAYGSNGIAALPEHVVAGRLQRTADNQILAMGAIDNASAVAVVRLDATGQVDSGYGISGVSQFDAQPGGLVSPMDAKLDAQQRLVVAGNDDNGALLPYRFARLTTGGELDVSFNGSAQQPGSPGLAAPVLTADGYFNALTAVLPLADGHLFAAGDAGHVSDDDGATNLALLRLNDDASFDSTFGDAVHPGWASLNVGGTPNGTTVVRALAAAPDGRVYLAVEGNDGNFHGCSGLVRIVPDRVFDARFDASAAPTCPQ